MDLRLELAIQNTVLTAHEGLKVEVRLYNEGAESLELPGTFDTTGALGFEFFAPDGSLKLRMDGQTHQDMLVAGRPQTKPHLEPLAPGAHWTWKLDLASYHYPIVAGLYDVAAIYRFPPAGIELRSERDYIHVSEPRLVRLDTLRDDPVLDGLTLLMQTRRGEEDQYFLRLYNHGKPLAAWYSERVLAGETMTGVFCSHAGFFQDDSFAPFFNRWIIWRDGAGICAQLHARGKPVGPKRRAPLPPGKRLLRSAFHTIDNRLAVFLLGPDGSLECHALDDDGLSEIFVHPLRGPLERDPVIGADEQFIHLALARRGVICQTLDHQGRTLDTRRLFRTRLPMHSCLFDHEEKAVKALFWDSPHGRTVQMAVGFVDQQREAHQQLLERVPLHGELQELSFDMDRLGRFHLAVSTVRGLYYIQDCRSPKRIFKGSGRFFPRVVTGMMVNLGLYQRRHSYRFFPIDQVLPI